MHDYGGRGGSGCEGDGKSWKGIGVVRHRLKVTSVRQQAESWQVGCSRGCWETRARIPEVHQKCDSWWAATCCCHAVNFIARLIVVIDMASGSSRLCFVAVKMPVRLVMVAGTFLISAMWWVDESERLRITIYHTQRESSLVHVSVRHSSRPQRCFRAGCRDASPTQPTRLRIICTSRGSLTSRE